MFGSDNLEIFGHGLFRLGHVRPFYERLVQVSSVWNMLGQVR
jgi:hypothetical protein